MFESCSVLNLAPADAELSTVGIGYPALSIRIFQGMVASVLDAGFLNESMVSFKLSMLIKTFFLDSFIVLKTKILKPQKITVKRKDLRISEKDPRSDYLQ